MLMLINILILFFVVLIIYQAIYVNPLLEGMKFNSKNNKKTKEGLEGQALEDHDQLILLKSQVKNKLLPLVENSQGKPTNILTRIAKLESDVELIGKRLENNTAAELKDAPEPKI
jgi:hypothetical protein